MSVTDKPAEAWVGQALKRREDPPLIMGQGSYTDDLSLPGMLHVAIVRSPEAHGTITSIDASAARGPRRRRRRLHRRRHRSATPRCRWPGSRPASRSTPPSTSRSPRARSSTSAMPSPSSSRPTSTARSTRPRTSSSRSTRFRSSSIPRRRSRTRRSSTRSSGRTSTHKWSLGGGDVEAGFAEADVVIERRIVNHRTSGAPIEPRAVMAEWRGGELTLTSTTQVPHITRLQLAGMLGIPEDRLRVIAPDVGGGFGAKLQVYGEEALLCWLARKIGRPVKWNETRSEHMTTSHHGRDQIDYVRMGAKNDGTVTTIHTKILADLGAYHMLLTPFIPCFSAFVMGGCYKIPNVQTDITGVFTNKLGTDAIRGAGRPEATHAARGDDGPDGRRAGDGPARAAPQELHPAGGLPGRGGGGHRLRLRQLRRGPGQAARDPRPRGVQEGAGRAARAGDPPRHRVLDLHGDLRPGAVARRRPVRGRPAGRLLGVGDGARAPVRLGHRLHRHLAARAGPRHVVRADRRRPPRALARAGRRDPRRHGPRPDGHGHVRLALAGRGRRVDRPRDQPRGRQGQEDRRPPARGGGRGRRARRRQVDGQGHRPGPGPGRHLAGRLRPGEPSRGDGPGPRGARLLRPGELRLPVRRPRGGRRRGRRDRQGVARALRLRGRLRPGDQPEDHRRPDPRRHRPRGRPGALRAGRLRRRGPARDRHLRRLRAAHRRRVPALRDRPHGDPVAGQRARGQGRGRGRHDRVLADDRQRGRRRAAPARHRPTWTCR